MMDSVTLSIIYNIYYWICEGIQWELWLYCIMSIAWNKIHQWKVKWSQGHSEVTKHNDSYFQVNFIFLPRSSLIALNFPHYTFKPKPPFVWTLASNAAPMHHKNSYLWKTSVFVRTSAITSSQMHPVVFTFTIQPRLTLQLWSQYVCGAWDHGLWQHVYENDDQCFFSILVSHSLTSACLTMGCFVLWCSLMLEAHLCLLNILLWQNGCTSDSPSIYTVCSILRLCYHVYWEPQTQSNASQS